jgi:nicotinate-nucleotide pyrophosphorylase (carboxylating)
VRWRRGGDQDDERDDGAEDRTAGRDDASSGTPPSAERTADAIDPWQVDAEAVPVSADAGVAADVPLDLADLDPADLDRARRRAVARALAEDLGDRGDVTSLATVPAGTTGTADLVARAAGVVAGVDVVRVVFDQVDPRVRVSLDVADGDRVEAGQVLGTVTGPLRSILTGERTALNFLCHLSGIATRTRAFVDAVAGTACAIRDTRKTTPGLRLLEKAAVRAGGGHNHRVGLYDAILVKDNHVAAAGSLTAAVEGALAREGVHVQVEVASFEELDEALALGVTDVLLDNFTPDQVRQAVQRVGGRAALEASGTIGLEHVGAYAAAGVGRVAIGAVTHSAPNLDIALDVRAEELETPSYLAAVWSEGEIGGAGHRTDPTATAVDADEPTPRLDTAAAEGEDPSHPFEPRDEFGPQGEDLDAGGPEAPDADAAASDPSLPSDTELEGPSAAPGFVDAATGDPDAPSESGLFAWRERQLGDSGRD